MHTIKKMLSFALMKVVITYKDMKSCAFRATITHAGDLHVTAPTWATRDMVNDFLLQNKEKIKQGAERMQRSYEHRRRFFAQLSLNTPQQRREATRRLDAIVRELVMHYTQLMGVNPPAAVTYRANTSRWGSCNHKTRRLSFSLYLLLLPHECIEHVVVHELTHLLVPNHSPAFHALMDKYFPRWREARRETRLLCYGPHN